MRRRDHVLLRKGADSPTPFSLGIAFWVRGLLMGDLVVGQPIELVCYARSAQESGEAPGAADQGFYSSTAVTQIEPEDPKAPGSPRLVTTLRSVWEVTLLPPPTEEELALLEAGVEVALGGLELGSAPLSLEEVQAVASQLATPLPVEVDSAPQSP